MVRRVRGLLPDGLEDRQVVDAEAVLGLEPVELHGQGVGQVAALVLLRHAADEDRALGQLHGHRRVRCRVLGEVLAVEYDPRQHLALAGDLLPRVVRGEALVADGGSGPAQLLALAALLHPEFLLLGELPELARERVHHPHRSGRRHSYFPLV